MDKEIIEILNNYKTLLRNNMIEEIEKTKNVKMINISRKNFNEENEKIDKIIKKIESEGVYHE